MTPLTSSAWLGRADHRVGDRDQHRHAGLRGMVQLYIRDRVASITRPVREMKAFRKVALAPGKSERVSFTLTRAQLEFLGTDLRPTVEPGTFDVWIAPRRRPMARTGRSSW